MSRDQVPQVQVVKEEAQDEHQEQFNMKTEQQQPQSEPQCCAICFAEPTSPLNVGPSHQSPSQQQVEQEQEGNKENLNHRHASTTCTTTVNHASGFAYLSCCGGAQGQCEATTSTKICTSCIMTLCQ
jgi:hypothetical protein